MKTLFQSLRWRLQAWHGLMLAAAIIGFTVPTYHFARENQMQRIDRDLGRMERNLIRSLMDAVQGFQPDPARPDSRQDRPFLPFPEFVQRLTTEPVPVPPTVAAQFQGTEPGYAYFSIRDKDDKILLQSANAPSGIQHLPIPDHEITEEVRSVENRRESLRSSPHGLKIVVGRDITPDMQEMQTMASLHLLIGLGVWLLGLLGGWWFSGRAIRPIQDISQTASRIAEGNLQERINTTETTSELGRLSQVLNQTFERLHSAFERQRQFTADASHELRTPLTILLSETQRILKRDRTPEEYREALQTCGHTAQRMRRLVEALLLLARLENQPLLKGKDTAGTPARNGTTDTPVGWEGLAHAAPPRPALPSPNFPTLRKPPGMEDTPSSALPTSNLATNGSADTPVRQGSADTPVRSGLPTSDLATNGSADTPVRLPASDLATNGSADTPVRLPPSDLATVLADVATHLQPLATEHQRTITLHLTPTPCQAEPEAITILATNLIANALQHGGNVTVTCHTHGTDAVLTVKDDGPGIAETDLPHIFERFYRADQARTSTSGHTGLGLAITKAIIDNHGGTIRVSSPPGAGAAFEVRLPATIE